DWGDMLQPLSSFASKAEVARETLQELRKEFMVFSREIQEANDVVNASQTAGLIGVASATRLRMAIAATEDVMKGIEQQAEATAAFASFNYVSGALHEAAAVLYFAAAAKSGASAISGGGSVGGGGRSRGAF